ncbi:MAG: hypothetical protein ACOYJC_03455 [Christensenellales bacterium]|jgi:hypothetical protein
MKFFRVLTLLIVCALLWIPLLPVFASDGDAITLYATIYDEKNNPAGNGQAVLDFFTLESLEATVSPNGTFEMDGVTFDSHTLTLIDEDDQILGSCTFMFSSGDETVVLDEISEFYDISINSGVKAIYIDFYMGGDDRLRINAVSDRPIEEAAPKNSDSYTQIPTSSMPLNDIVHLTIQAFSANNSILSDQRIHMLPDNMASTTNDRGVCRFRSVPLGSHVLRTYHNTDRSLQGSIRIRFLRGEETYMERSSNEEHAYTLYVKEDVLHVYATLQMDDDGHIHLHEFSDQPLSEDQSGLATGTIQLEGRLTSANFSSDGLLVVLSPSMLLTEVSNGGYFYFYSVNIGQHQLNIRDVNNFDLGSLDLHFEYGEKTALIEVGPHTYRIEIEKPRTLLFIESELTETGDLRLTGVYDEDPAAKETSLFLWIGLAAILLLLLLSSILIAGRSRRKKRKESAHESI